MDGAGKILRILYLMTVNFPPYKITAGVVSGKKSTFVPVNLRRRVKAVRKYKGDCMAKLIKAKIDKIKLNPSTDTKLNEKFYDLICLLDRGKRYVMEACFDSNNVYIIFNTDYKIYEAPTGFDIIESRLGNCDECGGNCSPYSLCPTITDIKTILVYSEFYPCLSPTQLAEIIEDLTTWVYSVRNLTPMSRSGRFVRAIDR